MPQDFQPEPCQVRMVPPLTDRPRVVRLPGCCGNCDHSPRHTPPLSHHTHTHTTNHARPSSRSCVLACNHASNRPPICPPYTLRSCLRSLYLVQLTQRFDVVSAPNGGGCGSGADGALRAARRVLEDHQGSVKRAESRRATLSAMVSRAEAEVEERTSQVTAANALVDEVRMGPAKGGWRMGMGMIFLD